MIRKIIALTLLGCLTFSLSAQKMNWRKHLKLADDFYKKSQYQDAALHYKAAWLDKNNRLELINKAGECYSIVKDYVNAADAFQHVKEKRKNFPLAGFKYAMALKQAGQYEAASREFSSFSENYKGPERDRYVAISANEIKGCEFALQQSTISPPEQLQIQHLGSNINSPETEFAPIPISDDLLYFSSTMDARAQIYASKKEEGTWSKAIVPPSFPPIDADHFCNGTLTPDGKRFYFTICKSEETWGGLTTRCEIHFIKKTGSSWSAPERLDDYVNLADATSTHPFVIYNGDTEVLYFASNRPGGEGGMDLWFMTRDISSDGVEFTFPINCGKVVNTSGDEITPFYDIEEATLYFSSNGHINIGGYDIYQSKGSRTQWDNPQNIGQPLNSSADDYFFILTEKGASGFLVSNRIFQPRKPVTTHEDIFTFSKSDAGFDLVSITGRIYDKYSGAILPNVTVAIFEVKEDGSKSLIAYQSFDDGNYEFKLERDKRFELEAQKTNYQKSGFKFDTFNPSATESMTRAILLENLTTAPPVTDPNPPVTDPPVTNPLEPNPTPDPSTTDPITEDPGNTTTENTPLEPGTPYTTRSKSPADPYEYITSAPRHQGVYYKIQLAAVGTYEDGDSRFSGVVDLGRIDSEFIVERNLTRVLLADFFSLPEARAMLQQVQQRDFEKAYIVQYEDGQRVRQVR